jgi:glutathione S-transferase
VKLYFNPGSCSLASHIVLDEVGAPFERVLVSTATGANKEAAYKAINPRGLLPALDYGEGILTENAAIMLFLAQRFPDAKLLPAEPKALAKCLEWTMWQTNTAHVVIATLWRTERFLDDESDYGPLKAAALPRLERVGQEIEAWLDKHAFAAGEVFSLADPMFLVLYRWSVRAGLAMNETTRPAWTAYARKLSQRPSVARALAAEGIDLFTV